MWSSFFACRSGYLHKGGMGNCQALNKFYFDFYLSIALFITSAHLQFISSAFFPLSLLIYRAELSRNLLFGGPSWFYWVFQHCTVFFTLHTPSGLLLHTYLVSKKSQNVPHRTWVTGVQSRTESLGPVTEQQFLMSTIPSMEREEGSVWFQTLKRMVGFWHYYHATFL